MSTGAAMANESKTTAAKWSEGPWTVGSADRKADGSKLYVVRQTTWALGRCARRIDGATAGIAVAHVLAAPGRGEQVANAALIGAATEMHGALRLAFDVLHAGHRALEAECPDVVCRQIHAALAKAEGR